MYFRFNLSELPVFRALHFYLSSLYSKNLSVWKSYGFITCKKTYFGSILFFVGQCSSEIYSHFRQIRNVCGDHGIIYMHHYEPFSNIYWFTLGLSEFNTTLCHISVMWCSRYQFHWWRKPTYLAKTTVFWQVTDRKVNRVQRSTGDNWILMGNMSWIA